MRYQIDYQPERKRHEIADVLPDRRLPLEAAAGEAAIVDQRNPERPFTFGRVAAE